MKKPSPTHNPQDAPAHHQYLRWVGLGFQLVAFIGIFAAAGWFLDQRMHTVKPWFTLGLSLTGIILAMVWLVIKFSRKS